MPVNLGNLEDEMLAPEKLATYNFVNGAAIRADRWEGNAPLWFGWALREAFYAGILRERKQAARDKEFK